LSFGGTKYEKGKKLSVKCKEKGRKGKYVKG
jgi:hypothetical protein